LAFAESKSAADIAFWDNVITGDDDEVWVVGVSVLAGGMSENLLGFER
jgi:hypothetical protein